MPTNDTDVLVIGAGPAGASVAIRLAALGWKVALIEQSAFPRQKVCGECLGPASLELLEEIGLGTTLAAAAGPSIRTVAWMMGEQTVLAKMPPCTGGRHAYGCALGRDRLDWMLLEHARACGVEVIQPAKVRRVSGGPGEFACSYEWQHEGSRTRHADHGTQVLRAAVVVDAHGSWERGPTFENEAQPLQAELPSRPMDLLAFKTTFEASALESGVLPVLCLRGGYGGIVVADRARTTIACCVSRATLQQLRMRLPGVAAGLAVDSYLRSSCGGVADALRSARQLEPWRAVGPLRTGFHGCRIPGILQIGNAGAEAHPLIGEGICMALQSAAVLARLMAVRPRTVSTSYILEVQHSHTLICKKVFSGRLRFAQLCAQIAMRPVLARCTVSLTRAWPALLTTGARLAGKARHSLSVSSREQAVA